MKICDSERKCTRNLSRQNNHQCKIVKSKITLRIIKSLKVAKECILSTTTAVYVVFIDDKRQSTIVTVLMKELWLFAEYLYLYIFSHVQGFKCMASIIYCAYSNSDLSFEKCINIMYGFIAPLHMNGNFIFNVLPHLFSKTKHSPKCLISLTIIEKAHQHILP